MRAMSRRTLAALIVGWLLGIVTALATPGLVWQRQSLVVVWPRGTSGGAGGDKLIQAIEQGWIVTHHGGQDYAVYTLERPRIRLP